MPGKGWERSFERGKASLEQGEALEALVFFEAAVRQARRRREPPPAKFLSYYGLCLGIATGKLEHALEACRTAKERQFYNAELYLNLGKVYLFKGDRAAAFRTYLSGLNWESDHEAIGREVERMGRRRRPFLPFLARTNAFNRLLGRLAARG